MTLYRVQVDSCAYLKIPKVIHYVLSTIIVVQSCVKLFPLSVMLAVALGEV